MLEVIVNIVPCGDESKIRQVAKLQIINTGEKNKRGYVYEARNCDVGEDSYRMVPVSTAAETDLLYLIQKAIKEMQTNGIDLPRRVPKSEYVTADGVGACVPMDAVRKYHTTGEVDRFCKFMYGQTSCEHGVYSCDYERWLRGHMKNSQGADWD